MKHKHNLLSNIGKYFNENKLDENTLNSNVTVIWRNKEYVTGNRKNDLVELWDNGLFFKTVRTRYLRLIQK